ncbi:MAG TPA: hypothetical protein VFT16_02720 [Candidatus Saccharimonadales bacterium]|nr:hypothetical protein [Candidatus Saccharimonadales bacterium]
MLAVLGIAGFGYVGLRSSEGFRRLLDDWGLHRRQERFTELYFDHADTLPSSVRSDSPQTLVFKIHNLEHRQATYYYEVRIEGGEPVRQEVAQPKAVVLKHGQIVTASVPLRTGPSGKRLSVFVSLRYPRDASQDDQPEWQQQSIHYMADIAPAQASRRGGI